MTHPTPRSSRLSALVVLLALGTPGCLADAVESSNGSSEQEVQSGVCKLGESRICEQEVDPDQQGIAHCITGASGPDWGACEVNPDMGKANCDPSHEVWDGYCCADVTFSCCAGESCNTPLVLAFDDAPVRYTAAGEATGFDLSRHGASERFDWPTAATPWLALDLDGNGAIDGGGELFGSATRLPHGGFATNGFEALAAYDANGDGRIDPADPVWSRLVLWRDRDSNRVSHTSELGSLEASGIYRLDVSYRIAPSCDERGNCGIEQGTMGFLDGDATRQGRIIDVHLRVR